MIGGYVEIDRQLLQHARGAKALQPVHGRVHRKPLHPAPRQIGSDSQGMGIDIAHAGKVTCPRRSREP